MKKRKKVSGPFPSLNPQEMDNLWMRYRDPKTGEPINFTWMAADFIDKETGKPYYKEWFFEDLKSVDIVRGLPLPATSPLIVRLWEQWWKWKRGELK